MLNEHQVVRIQSPAHATCKRVDVRSSPASDFSVSLWLCGENGI